MSQLSCHVCLCCWATTILVVVLLLINVTLIEWYTQIYKNGNLKKKLIISQKYYSSINYWKLINLIMLCINVLHRWDFDYLSLSIYQRGKMGKTERASREYCPAPETAFCCVPLSVQIKIKINTPSPNLMKE